MNQHTEDRIIERIWKVLSPDQKKLKELLEQFHYPEFITSILMNKGINTPDKINQYIKPSVLNLHSPFCFKDMRKAIERIEQALSKQEAILIFGDKDVDGVTATAIVHKFLQKLEANVVYRVPEGNENYGISKDVIQWAAMNEMTLIITVDCGITSIDEIEYANSLGIDVILTDHHEQREVLPKAYAVINPKAQESGYPFISLSGSSVAMKLILGYVEKHHLPDYHGQEIVFLDIETTGLNPTRDEIIELGAVCMKDGVKIGEFQKLIKPVQTVSEEITKITGITNKMLEEGGIPLKDALTSFVEFIGNRRLVGHNLIDFDMRFIAYALKKELQVVLTNPMEDTLKMSRVMLKKVNDHKLNTVARYLGLFVDEKDLHRSVMDSWLCAEVYRRLLLNRTNKIMETIEEFMPLAAIGTIADIMPLVDENRNIVKNGLKLIQHSSIGLISLLRAINMNMERITSRDISWTVAPMLNSPGRVGEASYSIELLISNKIKESEDLVKEILTKDTTRKGIVDDGVEVINQKLDRDEVDLNKIIFLASQDFTKGTTGLLANRLCNQYFVPAVIIAIDKQQATGSIRALPGFNVVQMLDSLSDLFLQFGGHKSAGGFTVKIENLDALREGIYAYMKNVDPKDLVSEITIDAALENIDELNLSMIRYLENILEPTGNGNEVPKMLIRKVKIATYRDIGKTGAHSLMTIQKGNKSISVTAWNWAHKLKPLFEGKEAAQAFYDIVATPEINKYQGLEEAKLNLVDIKRSE